MEREDAQTDLARQMHNGKTCLALGAGVGVMGAAAAALIGAVCPLCVVAAPGLMGYGAVLVCNAGVKAGR